jgi:D-threo-aldose 1-dehydrogenase
MIDFTTPRAFGRTPFKVTPLALGTSSWGPRRPTESPAERTERIGEVADAFFARALPTNVIDTSNEYGRTDEGDLSERLVGEAIVRASGVASDVVLQTKLDRDAETGSFSAARMWQSLEESLRRLGVDHIDVLYLHDPEAGGGFTEMMGPGGAVSALLEMKAQGITDAVGISGGPVEMLEQFVSTDLFDALITHNRFTPLDRSASRLLDEATRRGMGIANAAPYGGGILTGKSQERTYGYLPLKQEAADALDDIRQLAKDADVQLGALALGFSLRDPRVHTTIVGASSTASWNRIVADAEAAVTIPEESWQRLWTLTDGIPAHDS